jgi:hypothetical protein
MGASVLQHTTTQHAERGAQLKNKEEPSHANPADKTVGPESRRGGGRGRVSIRSEPTARYNLQAPNITRVPWSRHIQISYIRSQPHPVGTVLAMTPDGTTGATARAHVLAISPPVGGSRSMICPARSLFLQPKTHISLITRRLVDVAFFTCTRTWPHAGAGVSPETCAVRTRNR